MRKHLFSSVAAAIFAATPAIAQDGGLFEKLDGNKDGFVSQDEVAAPRKPLFERLVRRGDKDSDGKLSKEEFASALKQNAAPRDPLGGGRTPKGRPEGPRPGQQPFPPSPLLRALDGNADGEISAEEIAEASKSLARLDKNGDGKLTRDEIVPMPPRRAGEGVGPQAEAFIRRVKEADADGDGKLSKEEAPERMKANFDRVDANSDGFIDETELRQMFQRIQANRPGARPRDGERPRSEGGSDDDRPGNSQPARE